MTVLDVRARLRRGSPADLDALLRIKAALPMQLSPGPGRESSRGGFLLGSDPAHYRQLLSVARVWLLEVDAQPAGFSLTLDDPVLRASPLWAEREAIDWDPSFDPEAVVDQPVAYFDQLAVLPSVRRRYWGAALALRALAELFDEADHARVLTTTVLEPVRNRAALPYLARVGARQVGVLAERYPEVGPVVSAIHSIAAEDYREHIAALLGEGRPATRRVIEAIQP